MPWRSEASSGARAAACTMDWELVGSERRGDVGHALFEARPRCEAEPRFQRRTTAFSNMSIRTPSAGGRRATRPHRRRARRAHRDTGRRWSLVLDQSCRRAGGFAPEPSFARAWPTSCGGPTMWSSCSRSCCHGAGARGPGLRLGLKRLLIVITAFTLAHSITLALASLHVWSPPPSSSSRPLRPASWWPPCTTCWPAAHHAASRSRPPSASASCMASALRKCWLRWICRWAARPGAGPLQPRGGAGPARDRGAGAAGLGRARAGAGPRHACMSRDRRPSPCLASRGSCSASW